KRLEKHNVYIINERQVLPSQKEFLRTFFLQHVSPALVTIILNDLAELPRLKDSAAYLAVKMVMNEPAPHNENARIVERPIKEKKYVLIEIPRSIERFVVLPKEGNKQYVILLDDLIRYHLHSIFNIFEYES